MWDLRSYPPLTFKTPSSVRVVSKTELGWLACKVVPLTAHIGPSVNRCIFQAGGKVIKNDPTQISKTNSFIER